MQVVINQEVKMFGLMSDNYLFKEKFKAGIYCRLSREDEGGLQSESIKNQKEFLTKYVLEQGWQVADIYIDDGYSGTTFDRPDFLRLLQDIEAKKVNLVITKDLSRLGRDYIQTGHYIEKFFPEKSIRYIAVNDGIDTFLNSAGNDISPFRSVINDMYARDISVKVRSAMDSKRKSGKFIGAFAPYGYSKDPEDNNRLIIDQETAPVIRRIFQLFLSGKGLTAIAHQLNEEDIITPTENKEKVSNYKGTVKVKLWCHATIKFILQNPTYMGCLAQHKYKKVNYKSKKQKTLPKDRWIVVDDTHEAIIDKKTFEDVQKLISRKSNTEFMCKRETRLFSGFVFCGDCGSYMTTTKIRGKVFLICSVYKRYTSKYCTRHSFVEEQLKKIILEDIQTFAEESVDKSKLYRTANKLTIPKPEQHLEQEMIKIQNRLEEIKKVIKSLYNDKVKGVLDEQDFIELNGEFAMEKTALGNRYEILHGKAEELKKEQQDRNGIVSLVEEIMILKELDRYALEKLISKIEIFEGNQVKIHYRFKNPEA